MGGVPRNPEIVEGWLRSKTGVTDEDEIQSMMRRTMIEMGTWRPDMSAEEIAEASRTVAQMKETTGFKRDDSGLYIESRQVKAALKESTNILFAGELWGATLRRNAKGEDVIGYRGKGPRSFFAERVFVSPDKLYLGRSEPDGVELVIGHIVGAQGPRSTLGYHEYAVGSKITFDVLVAHDVIKNEQWADIWNHAEENGLGAMRSQGYGRFDVLAWDEVKLTSNAPAVLAKPSAAHRNNSKTLVPA